MAEFEAECLQGVHLGMDGKTLIHPKQIAAANLLFAPSESEVSACRRMIEAHAGKDCEVQMQPPPPPLCLFHDLVLIGAAGHVAPPQPSPLGLQRLCRVAMAFL